MILGGLEIFWTFESIFFTKGRYLLKFQKFKESLKDIFGFTLVDISTKNNLFLFIYLGLNTFYILNLRRILYVACKIY